MGTEIIVREKAEYFNQMHFLKEGMRRGEGLRTHDLFRKHGSTWWRSLGETGAL